MKYLILFFLIFSKSFAGSKPILKQGHVTFAALNLDFLPVDNSIWCKGKKIPLFLASEKKAFVYLSANYFSKIKNFKCKTIGKGSKVQYFEIKMKRFPYKEVYNKLKVDKKRVELNKKDLNRALKEKELLRKIYAKSSGVFLFDEAFKRPLNSKLTSIYGNRRIFNKNKKTQHLGYDFRAPVGTPIPSANKGKVVLAQDLFFPGNTVIIDHGLGIFTMYGHLSKINAQVGMMVKKGEIIGLAGATGRVTGPHLHWGVKVHGSWVDGLVLVKESEKHLKEERKLTKAIYEQLNKN